MSQYQFLVLLSAVLVMVVVIVGIVAFRVFNSPDGERYQKMRMQGPFVPLSAEDIAEDEERISSRKGRDKR